ncbi:MAG: 6,7-dimethyl-8-ribityllumazine synthase [Bacteroidales bacterium]|nr:6,7-dimethyl-8-ribityllumazine synthase [Bacteroidales bacterium]
MITKKVNLSDYNAEEIPNGEDFKIGIVCAEWNAEITNALLEGAYDTLVAHGVKESNIKVEHVPGSYELSTGSDFMLTYTNVDAVIAIGCVIQGDTRHFDFICEAVSQGLTNVSINHHKPVIFTLLTTNDMQQALDRCGGKHGNKGVEGAVTALKMVALKKKLSKLI